jgi:hypothetical protein
MHLTRSISIWQDLLSIILHNRSQSQINWYVERKDVIIKARLNQNSSTLHQVLLTGNSADIHARKHAARHNKEHVCRVPGCARADGFTTVNDLERHQRSVHNIRPGHGQSRQYKCFGQNCSAAKKVWPRFDNFKQHLKRMHSDKDMEMLISK